MPTFTSGLLGKFRPMIIGGALCWVFAIAAFIWQGYHAYLLCAAGATFAWIIPGFILRADFKKQLREGKI